MADRTLTINHADGGSETYTINRDKFAGVRSMSVDGATVSVDHTAVPKEQSKETTFGGSQSITVKRDIEPLLSKVVGGAAAAYSLRDLNDKAGNNKVVRVRRASDNHERDFLAKEVSNGTLTSWVKALTDTAVNGTGSYNHYTLTNASYNGFSANNRAGGYAMAGFPYSFTNGDEIAVQFTVSNFNNTGSPPQLMGTDSTSTGSQNSDFQFITANGTYTKTLTATADGTHLMFRHFGTGSYTISDFQITSSTGNKDGFVETWYDQSGNGSDATQLTAGSQPKIVNAGSLVTGGIDFLDGTDTFLETTNSDICNVPQLSLFTVLTPHIANSQTAAFSCGANVAGSTGYGGWVMNLNGYNDRASFQTQAKGDTTIHSVQTSVTSSEALVSFVSTFPNASISKDGGTAVTTSSLNAPNQTSTGARKFRIGCAFTFRTSSFYTKPIKEIILYTSDQSANRPAIEANINNQYDIY